MKQQIHILLILIIGITSCQDIDVLVASIAKENRVECKTVGFAGSPSMLYKKFEELKEKATKEELIKLTTHDSLAVVGYSSYALIDRELIAPIKLLQRFINTEEYVSTICNDILSRETLAPLIYHRYWNNRIEFPEENGENYILNDSKDLQSMDSLILYARQPNWILLARAFENRIYSNQYKMKIEEWAFAKNDFYALKYVFNNLRQGNEEKLIKSFKEYINNKDNYDAQKEEINQMMNEIKIVQKQNQ